MTPVLSIHSSTLHSDSSKPFQCLLKSPMASSPSTSQLRSSPHILQKTLRLFAVSSLFSPLSLLLSLRCLLPLSSPPLLFHMKNLPYFLSRVSSLPVQGIPFHHISSKRLSSPLYYLFSISPSLLAHSLLYTNKPMSLLFRKNPHLILPAPISSYISSPFVAKILEKGHLR